MVHMIFRFYLGNIYLQLLMLSERNSWNLYFCYQGDLRPDLLHGEFTCNEYTRRVSKQDLGKRILYRGPRMNGW